MVSGLRKRLPHERNGSLKVLATSRVRGKGGAGGRSINPLLGWLFLEPVRYPLSTAS